MHLGEARRGLGIDHAVDASRAKAALESGNVRVFDSRPNAITDPAQVGDGSRAVQYGARPVPGRFRPDTDAGAGETRPVERLAGIGLAIGRNIRMPHHAMRRDRVPRKDLAAEA